MTKEQQNTKRMKYKIITTISGTLILFSFIVVLFPMLWKYYWVNSVNFIHWTFAPIIIGLVIFLLYPMLKIRDLNK